MKRRTFTKIALTSMLAVASLWCHAQTARTTTVHFADATGGEVKRKYALDHPTVVPDNKRCEVSGFMVSFLPQGGELFGPFRNKGNKLTENQMNYLREFTEKKVRIFIENITLNCGSDTAKANAIVVTSIP